MSPVQSEANTKGHELSSVLLDHWTVLFVNEQQLTWIIVELCVTSQCCRTGCCTIRWPWKFTYSLVYFWDHSTSTACASLFPFQCLFWKLHYVVLNVLCLSQSVLSNPSRAVLPCLTVRSATEVGELTWWLHWGADSEIPLTALPLTPNWHQ